MRKKIIIGIAVAVLIVVAAFGVLVGAAVYGWKAAQRAGNEAAILVLITSVLGIALRLFLLSAAGFDYRGVGRLFRRVFWALFVLDVFWALSPFLLAHKIGVGLAFAGFATLVWLPFAQRTLVQMTYGHTPQSR